MMTLYFRISSLTTLASDAFPLGSSGLVTSAMGVGIASVIFPASSATTGGTSSTVDALLETLTSGGATAVVALRGAATVAFGETAVVELAVVEFENGASLSTTVLESEKSSA